MRSLTLSMNENSLSDDNTYTNALLRSLSAVLFSLRPHLDTYLNAFPIENFSFPSNM